MTSLSIDLNTGLLNNTPLRLSPNCDNRPPGVSINLLVIHGISLPPGEFGGEFIDALFLNQLDKSAHPYFQQIANLHVSAHVLIRRDGQLIQYVPFNNRAWHAGVSQFAGQEHCNDFSIGIELEGADNIPYTPHQYQQLVRLTHAIMHAYPAIQRDRITGHSDIAPQRKTDPGPAFDWACYHQLLAKET